MASLHVWQQIRENTDWLAERDWTRYYAMPYFTMRGAWYRRHDTFYTILRTMHKDASSIGRPGFLLDYGCGVGTVGLWLLKHRPGWHGVFMDNPGPTQDFVRWRLRRMNRLGDYATTPAGLATAIETYDVVLCLDVFEHLPKPHETLALLLDRLRPGGHLFCSMSPDSDAENIGGQYRPDVLTLLDLTCETRLSMTATTMYGHYVKRG